MTDTTFDTPAAALAFAVTETVAARDNAALFRTALAGRIAEIEAARADAAGLGATPLELLAFDRLLERLNEARKVLANYVARLDEDVRAVDPSVEPVAEDAEA